MAAMSATASKPVALLLGDTFPDIEAETTEVSQREREREERGVAVLFFV